MRIITNFKEKKLCQKLLWLLIRGYRTWTNVLNNFEPKEEGKGLSTNDFTNEDKAKLLAMQDRIDISTNDTYTVKGSVAFENLPTEGNEVGFVYNITNEFTTDTTFILTEQNKKLPAGTNIVYTSSGWDNLGWYI